MGYSAVLDSSILVKGQPATAGSKMLESFIAPFDATVVERLCAADVDIVGKCETGEFGVGGLFQECEEAGRALIDIADGKVDFALCNDYTGLIAKVASTQGLFYIHPAYGSVSRYGLIQSVCSMDQIGVLCKELDVGFEILSIITEISAESTVIKNTFLFSAQAESNIQNTDTEPRIHETKKHPLIQRLNNQPCIHEITNYPYLQVMQVLCSAELSNNVSRYDGIKFGYRAEGYNNLKELYTRSRTEGFGVDVKLALMIGAMVLYQGEGERVYDKAMKVRRLIRDSFDFGESGVVKVDDPMVSRLCGFMAVTMPEGTFVSNVGCDDLK